MGNVIFEKAAGDRVVNVMGRAGTRMFEEIEGELETAGVIETPAATHLRYRVG